MRWLSYFNLTLSVTILGVCGLIFFLPSQHEEVYTPSFTQNAKKELPKSPFALSEESYQDIGEGPFALNWVPPQMQLPDLRSEIIFGGKNLRPDFQKASFYLTLKGSQESCTIQEGERIYLVYQGNFSKETPSNNQFVANQQLWGDVSSSKGTYIFSPVGQTTPLWIEMRSLNEQTAEVKVNLVDEKGMIVSSPSELHTFIVQAQGGTKTHSLGWDLGGTKVDSSLLLRQKARWVGLDRFLELHGGEEFSFAVGRERIDFLEGENPYSCFVKENDFLVWNENRWEVVQKGSRITRGLPLLVVKKIDEKIISFELWDPEGKGKLNLNLIRSKDNNGMPNMADEFKFVGAKTWAQFIVECKRSGRLTLKPHDWLVLTQEGWKKLDSPEDIDDYVTQKIAGPLFVLDKMTKQNGRQILLGHLFNLTRTEVKEVELTASSSATPLANFYRALPVSPPIQIQEEIEGCAE